MHIGNPTDICFHLVVSCKCCETIMAILYKMFFEQILDLVIRDINSHTWLYWYNFHAIPSAACQRETSMQLSIGLHANRLVNLLDNKDIDNKAHG